MNFHELQKRAKGLSVENILKGLKDKKVPVSDNEEVLMLDADRKEFTFERDLTTGEEAYFIEWLDKKIQKGIRDQLGL